MPSVRSLRSLEHPANGTARKTPSAEIDGKIFHQAYTKRRGSKNTVREDRWQDLSTKHPPSRSALSTRSIARSSQQKIHQADVHCPQDPWQNLLTKKSTKRKCTVRKIHGKIFPPKDSPSGNAQKHRPQDRWQDLLTCTTKRLGAIDAMKAPLRAFRLSIGPCRRRHSHERYHETPKHTSITR